MHTPSNRIPLIAIVDDDPDDRLFLKEGFISAGYTGAFIEFDNAVKFREWIKEHSSEDKCPNILLLDINMPKLSGLEFLRLMADNINFAAMKTCMISTSSAAKDMMECSQYGVKRYFTKPNDITGYKTIAKACFDLLNELQPG